MTKTQFSMMKNNSNNHSNNDNKKQKKLCKHKVVFFIRATDP